MRIHAAIITGALTLASAPAFAQSDFTGLPATTGEVVYVTSPDGVTVGGELTAVSPARLRIDGYDLAPRPGTLVEAPGDPVWDGALKGLGFGTFFAVVSLPFGGKTAALSSMVQMGVLGLVVDWAHHNRHPIFRVEGGPPRRQPRVELSIGTNVNAGGLGADSERTLTSLDFHPGAYSFFSEPSPRFYGQGHAMVSRRFAVGAIVNGTSSVTEGYRDQPSAGQTSISTSQSIVTTATIASYVPARRLRLGIGPALYQRRLDMFVSTIQRPPQRDTTLGWVAQAVAKIGAHDPDDGPPFFAEIIGQYQAAGSMDTSAALAPALRNPAGVVLVEPVRWPATSLRMSHWMFGFGIGFEL